MLWFLKPNFDHKTITLKLIIILMILKIIHQHFFNLWPIVRTQKVLKLNIYGLRKLSSDLLVQPEVVLNVFEVGSFGGIER